MEDIHCLYSLVPLVVFGKLKAMFPELCAENTSQGSSNVQILNYILDNAPDRHRLNTDF